MPVAVKKQEPKKQDPKKQNRVDLRLYNTIAIFDDYIVARTPEAAREVLLSMIASGDYRPMEIVTKEVTMANSIRASKTGDNPWMADDVSEEEFKSLKGVTNEKAFERFYQRR